MIQLQRFWDRIAELDLPNEAGCPEFAANCWNNWICHEPWISTYNWYERCGQHEPIRQPSNPVPSTGQKSFRSLTGRRFFFGSRAQNVLNTVGNIIKDTGWKPGMIINSIGNNIRGVIQEAGGFVDKIIKGVAAGRSSAESSKEDSYSKEGSFAGIARLLGGYSQIFNGSTTLRYKI